MLKKVNVRKEIDLQRYKNEIKNLLEINKNIKYDLSTYEQSYDEARSVANNNISMPTQSTANSNANQYEMGQMDINLFGHTQLNSATNSVQ